MTWILTDDNGTQREFDTRAEAERTKSDLEGLGATLELAKREGNTVVVVDEVEATDEDDADEPVDEDEDEFAEIAAEHEVDPDHLADTVATANEIAAQKQHEHSAEPEVVENGDNADTLDSTPNVTEDPISWMPEHFIDVIEGVPSINRKGYAVLAEHYGISVRSEPVTYPGESDWEYAEFRATAVTPDGDEYTGYGSAHVERGDDKTVLGELAETRACKRAVSWATGIGMTAVSEMKGSVEAIDE